MADTLGILLRFVVILCGYVAAALAASAFLNLVSLAALGFTPEEAPWVAMGSMVFSIPFIALFVAYFAFMPAVPAILLGEILGKRDWLFYALAGGIVAMVVLGFFWHSANEMYVISDGLAPDGSPQDTNPAISDPRLALMLIGSGMCGGIAYWLVAGRWAGNWRGRAGAPTSSAP